MPRELVNGVTVLGNLAVDVIDGAPPSAGGCASFAGVALAAAEVPARIVALAAEADHVLWVPPTYPLISPVVDVVPLQQLAYRLARRNAHNADAALANAFGAMRKEPAGTRLNEAACAQFVVLSHMLLNFLSALGAHRGEIEVGRLDAPTRQVAEQLQQGLQSLSQLLEQPRLPVVRRSAPGASTAAPDDALEAQSLLLSQLRLASRLLPELGQQALLFGAPR